MPENQPSKAEIEAALEAWDKYDLDDRADSPRGGAVVLLREAAEALNFAWMTIFEQDAVTDDVLRLAREAAEKAQHACLIAAIDPETEPKVGIVELLPGGGYRWQQI